MSQGNRPFYDRSAVQLALRKITCGLRELEIPSITAGGIVLPAQAPRRFTEEMNLIDTRDGLLALHHELESQGVPPEAWRKAGVE